MRRLVTTRLLTTAEVVEKFLLRPSTIRQWVRDGRLPSTRTLGGHLRFREADVAAFLEDDEERVNRDVTRQGVSDARLARLEELARWLVDLDRPEMRAQRQLVTLRLIIDRASNALGEDTR